MPIVQPGAPGIGLWSTIPYNRAMSRAGIGGADRAGGMETGSIPLPQNSGVDIGASLQAGTDAASPPPTSDASGGSSDLSGLSPTLVELTKRMMSANTDELTPEDKGLALAHAGFAMAGSNSSHPLQALGEGAVAGIDSLEKLRQQRALQRMKQIQELGLLQNYQSLQGQRGARTNQINQTVANTGAARFGPDETNQAVQYILDRGDVAGGLRMGGAGIVGTANRADIIRALNDSGHADLAQQALTYASALSQAEQTGKVAAGPTTLNAGAGDVAQAPRPLPVVVPAGTVRNAPAPTAAAPAPTPAPAAPAVTPPPRAVVSSPAPAEPPQPSPFDILPAPTPMPQATTPAMKTEADALVERMGQIDSAANGAKQTNFVFDNMNNAREHFLTGKGSTLWNEGNAYLLQAANGLNSVLGDGAVDTKPLEDKVGNFQEFQKNAVVLTGQATKAVSPRASTQEMNFLGKGVPSADQSDRGYGLVVSQLQGVNDFALAQQKACDLWLQNPKNPTHTLAGFDDWFNNNVDPAVFMLHRMSDQDAQDVMGSLDKRPGGKEMKAKLASQLATAKSLGLFVGQ